MNSLTITGGYDRQGRPEPISRISLDRGDIMAIVGRSGSGKTQLIEDIDAMAQGTTVSERQIWIDNNLPDATVRFFPSYKIISRLSRNMDTANRMTVKDYILRHASEQSLPNPLQLLKKTLECANEFAHDPIQKHYYLRSLSSEQLQALLVSDLAIVEQSHLALIDNITYASIDWRRALDMLIEKEKIIVFITEDPMLVLLSHRRLFMQDGAMQSILETSENEKRIAQHLIEMDRVYTHVRDMLTAGEEAQWPGLHLD